MEIIVIDNHSDDDSAGILRTALTGIPSVQIVESPANAGFGAGYNFAARYAKGEYLLINNPDKNLQKEGVAELIKKMKSDPTIGILAPRLLHPDGTARLSMRRYPRVIDVLARRSFLKRIFSRSLRRYLMVDADPLAEQDVDWIAGGCFLIRRDFFHALGGFDDRFFLFFEDTDLCRRCRGAGKRVLYYPAVTGTDKKRRLSGERFRDLFKKTGRIHVISAIKYFLKWGVTY